MRALDSTVEERVQQFALEASRHASAPGLRVQVRVGTLDARLRLAPCGAVQPYLPAGTRLWGATRIGLRCADGVARWNVFLPIQVDVFGIALVAAAPLPAGAVLAADHLRSTEVNLAASPAAALTQQALAVGRTLARPLAAGDTVHATDLRARQWFAAGDTVRIVAAGAGWRISGEGQALAAGPGGPDGARAHRVGPRRQRAGGGRTVDRGAVVSVTIARLRGHAPGAVNAGSAREI